MSNDSLRRCNAFIGLKEFSERIHNTSNDALVKSDCFIGLQEYNRQVGIGSTEESSSNLFTKSNDFIERATVSPTEIIVQQPIVRMNAFIGLDGAQKCGIAITPERTKFCTKRKIEDVPPSEILPKRLRTSNSCENMNVTPLDKNHGSASNQSAEAMNKKIYMKKVTQMQEAVNQWNACFNTDYMLL